MFPANPREKMSGENEWRKVGGKVPFTFQKVGGKVPLTFEKGQQVLYNHSQHVGPGVAA